MAMACMTVQSAGAAESANADELSAVGEDEATELPQLPPKVIPSSTLQTSR